MNTKSLATTNNSPEILLINEFIYSGRLLEKVTKVTEVTNKVTRGYVTVTLETAGVTGISSVAFPKIEFRIHNMYPIYVP